MTIALSINELAEEAESVSLRLLMVGNLFVRLKIDVVVGSKVILCVREVCSRLAFESIT